MWRRRCEDDKDIKQDLSVFRENAGDNEKSYLTDTCLTAQDKYKAYLDYFRIAY